MILYITPKLTHAVITGMQGTYDILRVVPDTGQADWPVVQNRDWFAQAVELACSFEALVLSGLKVGDRVEDYEGDQSTITRFIAARVYTDRGWSYWAPELTRVDNDDEIR